MHNTPRLNGPREPIGMALQGRHRMAFPEHPLLRAEEATNVTEVACMNTPTHGTPATVVRLIPALPSGTRPTPPEVRTLWTFYLADGATCQAIWGTHTRFGRSHPPTAAQAATPAQWTPRWSRGRSPCDELHRQALRWSVRDRCHHEGLAAAGRQRRTSRRQAFTVTRCSASLGHDAEARSACSRSAGGMARSSMMG